MRRKGVRNALNGRVVKGDIVRFPLLNGVLIQLMRIFPAPEFSAAIGDTLHALQRHTGVKLNG
ncbi:hypothetical protein D3C76_1731650 [compost metagenome]